MEYSTTIWTMVEDSVIFWHIDSWCTSCVVSNFGLHADAMLTAVDTSMQKQGIYLDRAQGVNEEMFTH